MNFYSFYKCKIKNIILLIIVMMLSSLDLSAQKNPYSDSTYVFDDSVTIDTITEDSCDDIHLHFMGIPIRGDYKAFCQKLIDKGFVYQSTINDAVGFTRKEWAGQKNISAYVTFSRNNHVNSVVILIPCKELLDLTDKETFFLYKYRSRYGNEKLLDGTTDAYIFEIFKEEYDLGSIIVCSQDDEVLKIIYSDFLECSDAPIDNDKIDNDIY